MNIEDFLHLVDQSLSSEIRKDHELAQTIDDKIDAISHSPDPSILPMFFEYLNPETINEDKVHKERALFYLTTIFKHNITFYESDIREQFSNFIRSFIFIPQLSEDFENYLCIMAEYFFNKSSPEVDNFQEVTFEIISNLIQTNDPKCILRGSKFVCSIIINDFADKKYLIENYLLFYNFILTFLKFASDHKIPQLMVNGVLILSTLYKKTNISIDNPEIYQILLQSASLSPSWTSKQLISSFWTYLSLISSPDTFSPEICEELSQICISVSENQGLFTEDRLTVLETLVPILSIFPHEQVVEILNRIILLYGLLSQEEDDVTDIDRTFFSIFATFPHSTISQLALEFIQSTISSEDPNIQTIGFMILKEYCEDLPEYAHNDIDSFYSIIESALKSETRNIILIGLNILSTDSQFSQTLIKLHGEELIYMVLPYLSDDDMTSNALDACIMILSDLGQTIDGFFENYFNANESFDTDKTKLSFLSLLPKVIEKTTEISDDEIDQIFQFIQLFLDDAETNYEVKGPALLSLLPLISRDSAQLEGIQEYIPLALQFLEINETNNPQETPDIYIQILSFFEQLIKLGGFEIIESVSELIQSILVLCNIETAKDQSNNSQQVKGCAISTLAAILKRGESDQYQELLPVFSSIILDSLKLGNSWITEGCLFAISKVSKLYSMDVRKQFFSKAKEEILDDDEALKVDSLLACRRILKSIHNVEKDENYTAIMDMANEIVNNILNDSMETNEEDDDDDKEEDQYKETGKVSYSYSNGEYGQIFTYISRFLGEFLQMPTENAELINSIITYLCQASEKDSLEYNYSDSLLAFIYAIEADTLPQDFYDQILSQAISKFDSIQLPNTLQNVAYLFNISLIKHPEIQETIIQYLPQFKEWYQNCQSHSGFNYFIDNLSSLFFTILRNNISNNEIENPEEIFLLAIENFPPSDKSETNNMANSMILISQKGLSQEEIIKMAEAIFRLITSDDEIEIDEQLKNQLFTILRTIDPEIISNIRAQYSKSRSKTRKIDAVLPE